MSPKVVVIISKQEANLKKEKHTENSGMLHKNSE